MKRTTIRWWRRRRRRRRDPPVAVPNNAAAVSTATDHNTVGLAGYQAVHETAVPTHVYHLVGIRE